MLLETSTDRSFSAARRAVRLGSGWDLLLVAACLLYAAATAALWIFLRLQGDRWWVGTLVMLVPRWPMLLPLAVLGPWILWRRRWFLGALAAGCAAAILFPIMGVRAAIPSTSSQRGDLRILSCNVHREQVHPNELARVIAQVQPDVVALQDWTSANDHIFDGGDWNVRREGELVVASRFPIGKVIVLPIAANSDGPKAERGAAASFELLTPQGPIQLVNVHLASPHTGLITFRDDNGALLAKNLERRWDQSAMVRSLVDQLPRPVLLAGDFNTTDDSPIFVEHWSDFTDAFARCGWGLGLTYINRTTQIRIDHILLDRSWLPIRFWLEPEVGSPHRPIVADLKRVDGGADGSAKSAARASAGEVTDVEGR